MIHLISVMSRNISAVAATVAGAMGVVSTVGAAGPSDNFSMIGVVAVELLVSDIA
jgi:hypothetical protein